MMKVEDINTIEAGLKAMLEDEEKGIAEYDTLIQKASRLGATTTAMELQNIKEQESAHADTLRLLIGRAVFAKVGMLPGQETGAVMESRGRGELYKEYVTVEMRQMLTRNWEDLKDIRNSSMYKRSPTFETFIEMLNMSISPGSHEAVSHLLKLHGYTQKTYNEQLMAFWKDWRPKKVRTPTTVSEKITGQETGAVMERVTKGSPVIGRKHSRMQDIRDVGAARGPRYPEVQRLVRY